MAVQIPDLSPNVAPSTAPVGQFTQQATPNAFGADVGNAVQNVGAAGVGAGDAAITIATANQDLDNETNATAANTQFIAAMNKATFDPQTGYFAKQGKDAVDAYQPTMDDLNAQREAIGATLNNPRAQLMYDQASLAQLRRTEASIGEHAQQQRNVYMTQSSNALIDQAIDTATNYYNDQGRTNDATAMITGEGQKIGENNGWSATQVQQFVSQKVSTLWAQRIERMSTNDPVGAQALYRANIDQIDGQMHTGIEKMLKSAVTPVQTANLVNSITSGADTANPGLVDAIQTHESANIAGLTSDKGAMGVIQVMPDTARQMAANLNVPYDPDKLLNDPVYNRMLGTEYLKESLQRYGGNQTLALAAYDAGWGAVDKWIGTIGDPRTGVISDADFAAKIPYAETRNYVAAINAKVPPTAGTAPTSQDVNVNLPAWQAQLRTAAATSFPNDPVAQQEAQSHLLSYVGTIKAGAQYADKAARDTLMSSAMGFTKTAAGDYAQNPMATRPTSLTQLLADPNNKAAWAQADPIQQTSIMGILEKNANGQNPPLTDAAWNKYYQTTGLANRDPIAFAGVNLADPQYTDVLPHELTMKLMNQQELLQGRQAQSMLKGDSITRAETIAKPSLLAAGVAVSAKAGTPEAATYDTFVGKLDSGVSQFIDQNKRTPNDSELRQITNGLLTQGVIPGGSWFGLGSPGQRYFQSTPGQPWAPTVPDLDKQQISAAYQAKRGHAPSSSEINDIYMAGVLAGK